MDFITFVLAFGAGFVTVSYIAELLRSSKYIKEQNKQEPDCRQTNTMHSWYYDTDGYMKCSVCKRKPFED